MWGVYLEVDGGSVDPFVVSRYSCRLVFNLPLDVGELVELSPRNVMKLCPFILTVHACRCMRDVYFIVFGLV